ncbi:hypothetical protein [Cohnella luojiensis]|uniref:Uncharacterized protein n=1 Tax=Cohnella luojiensis TaxID=652876 RepID=A0A4Y8LPA8_9BACL|nr:hypothetical protein [Cohnella luojiensis]TFE22839.1 hypothetical protein E2980_20335 [Cohnella luojiensis]
MDFTFEILDSSTINIRFNYGGEWFEFNLFFKQEQWILHPFDASLLGNPEMSRFVIADLLANKPFQVMLAKQRILLSNLRTSVDVSGTRDPDRVAGGRFDDYEDTDTTDEVDDWIRSHTFQEILTQELQAVDRRLQLFNSLLQKMFYENLGPGNEEFDKVQEIARIYKDASSRMSGMIDPDSYLRDRNTDRKRF